MSAWEKKTVIYSKSYSSLYRSRLENLQLISEINVMVRTRLNISL